MLSDLDEQAEEDASPQQLLDVGARGLSNLFQTGPALPNYDSAMRRPLDVDQTMYSAYVFGFFPAFDHNCRNVRQLLGRDLQDLLAHELGCENSFRLIGNLVFRVKRLANGKILENLFDQQRDTVAGEC